MNGKKLYLFKHFAKCFFVMALVLCSLLKTTTNAYAEKTTLVPTRTATLYEEYDYNDRPYYKKIHFSLSKRSYVKLKLEADPQFGDVNLRIRLTDSEGNVYANDRAKCFDIDDDEVYYDWFSPDDFVKIPAGDYTYTITNLNEDSVKIKYSITAYDTAATTATVYGSKTCYGGDEIQIGYLPSSQYSKVKSITFSNSDILDYWYIDPAGKIKVGTWKSGTATATVKLLNGTKYTCRIKVKVGDPNFFAKLTAYSTRYNYFKVKFKNLGPEDITILSSGAKSMEVDYKSYDRKLHIKGYSPVTIPAGTTVTVKFYVEGSVTWYNYRHHTIRYYFMHNGTKYLGSTWHDGSSYKYDSKWWTTYWECNESEYDCWGY